MPVSPTGSLRAALCALYLIALSGCSMIGVGYNHLDTLALWRAADYFDLEPVQRHEFSQRFERLHAWHRREQLPDYARFMGGIKSRMERGIKREDVQWINDGVMERFREIARRGAPDAADLLASISPAQIDALKAQWEKDNRAFVREHRLDGPPEERLRARTRRALNQVKDWVGSLAPEQEQKLIELVRAVPEIERLRHEDRLRRQREFLQLLELRGNRADFGPRLARWLMHWEEGRTPEYQRRFAEWRERRAEFYVAVDRMLTPNQRATAMHRVQNYIEDFTRLAERGQATAAN